MTLGYYSGAAQGGAEWVLADTACRRCGQNLRGLHVTQGCPGCGTPAGFSAPERLLRFADAGWLARVRSGLLITFWGTLATLAVMVLVGGAAMVIAFQQQAQAGGPAAGGGNPSDVMESRAFSLIAGAVGLAGGIALLVGTFRLTSAEPRPGGAPPHTTVARRLARVAAALGLAHSFATLAIEPFGWTEANSQALAVVGGGFGLVQLVGWAAAVYVVAELADRVPDAGLAFRSRLSMWGVASVVGILLVLTLVLAVLGANLGEPDTSAVALGGGILAASRIMGLAGLTALVFFVFYLVSVIQLANRTGEARAYAEQVAAAMAANPPPAPAPAAVPAAAVPPPPHTPFNLP